MQASKTLTKSIAAIWMAAVSASALALTPGTGAWVQETEDYGAEGLQNAYVYVPANVTPQTRAGKRALMLTLHGCYQNAAGSVINQKYNWEATAEQYGMVVIAPTVPSGKSATRPLAQCWDWFGDQHTRAGRDAALLIKLIDTVKARKDLDIDPNQIYVSGLSSGAGVAHILACSFPDYIAGVVVTAAPTLGIVPITMFKPPVKTAEEVAATCKAYNGNQYNQHFTTQLFATIYGEKDQMLPPSHNLRNRDGMQVLYGATVSAGTAVVEGGGNAELWKDAKGKLRIVNVAVTDMKHAWAAGPGGVGGGIFADYEHMSLPVYITKWFFENNLRVAR